MRGKMKGKMNKDLKILILEDLLEDVDLIERELKRAGIRFTSTVVNNQKEFEDALMARPDVILSDHSLPSFNSIDALKIYKEKQSQFDFEAPFILVTGAVSEEFAVNCIKAGADDYILKDRLKRLPGSIENALERARLEAERRRYMSQVIANEAMLRKAEHLAGLGSWEFDFESQISKWSDEAYRIFGYEPGEVAANYSLFLDHVHEDDQQKAKEELDAAHENLDEYERKYRITTRDGKTKFVNSKLVITRDAERRIIRLNGFLLDITEETEYVRKIEEKNEKLREIAWMQSHGVRAPLARIMGLVNLIQNHKDDDTDVNEVLSMIIQSVEELDLLVRAVVRKTEELPTEL
jgi:PAS domain S-box-containing protein